MKIKLPYPMSLNHAFANVPGRGRVKTKAYREWSNTAGWLINAAKSAHKVKKPLVSELSLHLFVTRKYRGDLDNTLKPVLDALEKNGIVKNDRQFKRLTVETADVENMICVVSALNNSDDIGVFSPSNDDLAKK